MQGHIALDQAIFPERTPGFVLDVLARSSLWKVGLDYRHGSFLFQSLDNYYEAFSYGLAEADTLSTVRFLFYFLKGLVMVLVLR